jgi:V8-like Glu-specific endopeptidase
MPLSDSITAETTARYRERQQLREEMDQHIKEQGVLAANDPQLVAERLARLHADPAVLPSLARTRGIVGPPSEPLPRIPLPESLERVMGANDMVGIRFLEEGVRVGRAVARVHIRSGMGDRGFGTGFLVSPRLFLTNHHVIESADTALASKAEFNYERGLTDAMLPSEMFAFDPGAFFHTNPQLDYTLVAIGHPVGLLSFGWLQLISTGGKLMVGEKVNIIQHPNGEPKQIAIRDNKVIDELELFIHYRSDTAPGSSGAPVFNDQWELVALHHSGVPDIDPETGRQRANGGGLWDPSMGEHRAAWLANEGVRVSKLVADLELNETQERLSDAQRVMLEEMLDATPPPALLASPDSPRPAPVVAAPPPPQPPGGEAAAAGAAASGAVATWTIPLQVSIQLGSASVQMQPPAGVSAAPFPAPPAITPEEWLFFRPRPKPLPPPRFSLQALRRPGFQWEAALSLAMASQLAYLSDDDVRDTARSWGFDQCVPLSAGPAQCFVASTDDLVMVSFRGTESTADWLSNLNVIAVDTDAYGTVHAGFFNQFTALRGEIEQIFRSRPQRPVLITGHSLGGALALLGAATWVEAEPLQGLYTYGQPMVGKADFVRSVRRRLLDRYYRFVNDSDVVPRVPPGYRHSGQLYHFDARGGLKSQPPAQAFREAFPVPIESDSSQGDALTTEQFRALQAELRQLGTTRGSQEGFFTLISDHDMDKYIQKVQMQT